MGIYIIIYTLVLFVGLTDFAKVKPQTKYLLLLFLILILVPFRGLRWRTGTDWEQFEEVFNTCTWDVANYLRDNGDRMDMGWVFINRLVKIFGNYTLFLLLTNIFLVCSWAYLARRYLPNQFLLAFAMILITNMFFPVRLQIASGVFCWVVHFIIQRNYHKAIVIYVITCLLHKSAIMLVLVLPFLFIRISNKTAYVMLFLSLAGEVLSTIFSNYMMLVAAYIEIAYPELASNMVTYSQSAIVGLQEKSFAHIFISFLLSLILMYGIIWGRKILEKRSCYNSKDLRVYNIYMNCFVIYTFISKFFSSESLSNLTRMIEFFTFGYAMSIIFAYKYIKPFKNQLFYVAFFIVYYIVKFKSRLDTPYPDEYYPYYSIFDSAQRHL